MLAAIYALIINQSMKQKERKNAALRVTPPNKIQNIKPDNNIYFNAVFKANFASMPVENRSSNNINRDLPANLYKQSPFRAINGFGGSTQQETLYPVSFYYTPVAKREGSR
jgi:hypothetical protein